MLEDGAKEPESDPTTDCAWIIGSFVLPKLLAITVVCVSCEFGGAPYSSRYEKTCDANVDLLAFAELVNPYTGLLRLSLGSLGVGLAVWTRPLSRTDSTLGGLSSSV